MNDREAKLLSVQQADFVLYDAALYLDTHPDDREALELYQTYQKMYHQCAMDFGKDMGPLNHGQPTQGNKYRWTSDPWPWEYAGNKEC